MSTAQVLATFLHVTLKIWWHVCSHFDKFVHNCSVGLCIFVLFAVHSLWDLVSLQHVHSFDSTVIFSRLSHLYSFIRCLATWSINMRLFSPFIFAGSSFFPFIIFSFRVIFNIIFYSVVNNVRYRSRVKLLFPRKEIDYVARISLSSNSNAHKNGNLSLGIWFAAHGKRLDSQHIHGEGTQINWDRCFECLSMFLLPCSFHI